MAEAQQPLGLCINRMADLGKLWREDGSDEMVEKMCWSCFGVFDWDSSWSSTNCPQQIWNYSIEHACAIMHLTTSYASRLQEGMSIKAITGKIPDIFEYFGFTFYDLVLFKENEGLGETKIGWFLGMY